LTWSLAEEHRENIPSHASNDIGTSEEHGAIPSKTESNSQQVITRGKDRGIVIARRPIFGPKVAIYAGGIIPIALKKKIVKNESHHPR
jgi:hypothetical protein